MRTRWSDPAHEYTDRNLKRLERKIRAIYGQAIAEVDAEIEDYFRRFEIKDEKWRQWVKDGKKTKAEYRYWLNGQIAVGEEWEKKREHLANIYANADKAAYAVVYDHIPLVFAENINYATYQIEKAAKIDTAFTLYNSEAVERILQQNPEMLPPAGKKVSADIRAGRAVKWNVEQIQSVMMQGIIQGKSVMKIAASLASTVGDRDMKAAIRNARTMTTAAENAGRVVGMQRAQDMGIELQQQWMATLDNRTRHSHRMMDGERVDVGKTFSNGCRFPADPYGAPAEVYNCRCTLVAAVKGHQINAQDLGLRNTDHMEQQSYSAWKHSHKITSNPIELPAIIAAIQKGRYIREYKTL